MVELLQTQTQALGNKGFTTMRTSEHFTGVCIEVVVYCALKVSFSMSNLYWIEHNEEVSLGAQLDDDFASSLDL